MSRINRDQLRHGNAGVFHGDLESGVPLELRHTVYAKADKHSPKTNVISIGQRWSSIMEPELGIGVVIEVASRRITLSFMHGSSIRNYNPEAAPINRIIFQTGSTITTKDGQHLKVEGYLEENGILYYKNGNKVIPEIDLDDKTSFNTPYDRLKQMQTSTSQDFDLRTRIQNHQNEYRCSKTRGFHGGRIELLTHQISIANSVAAMNPRRVLLSDEAGLGKTIEAALILHRLLIGEEVTRCLVLVPESLIHVWFVELLRKFNLRFLIYNRNSNSEMQLAASDNGRLLQEPLILGDIDFIANQETRDKLMTKREWDLLIVDEVHRLRPNSTLHTLVQSLCVNSRDVIFLTATPQQHGSKEHFNRLHLLDPQRYSQYEVFRKEATHHRSIAELISRVLDNKNITEDDRGVLCKLLPDIVKNNNHQEPIYFAEPLRDHIVTALIDRYGTGRILFRNTRAGVGGFPGRQLSIIMKQEPEVVVERLRQEFLADLGVIPKPAYDYTTDVRIGCILDLLKEKRNEKFLLISASPQKASAIVIALKKRTSTRIAEFHEGLSLIQRDRNAAWFAETDGARLLVCSEIGSEGRNFQFTNNLILWDLPMQPDLLEQRIGRLDRIGQKKRISIHLPVVKGSPTSTLASLYNEGLNLFTESVSGATEMFFAENEDVTNLLTIDPVTIPDFECRVTKCIANLNIHKKKIGKELENGRDRLVELHSHRHKEAASLIHAIQNAELSDSFRRLALDLYKSFGILPEELSPGTYNLLSTILVDQDFPGLTPERSIATFDRSLACTREDWEFITPDHPSIRGGIDLFLGSEKGTTSCVLYTGELSDPSILLESVFVVECVAPSFFLADRFLAPVPLRIVVDHTGAEISPNQFSDLCGKSPFTDSPMPPTGIKNPEAFITLISNLSAFAEQIANQKAKNIIAEAISLLNAKRIEEVQRMKTLNKNSSDSAIQPDIDSFLLSMNSLEEYIQRATPRLDATRLIIKFRQR